MRGDQLARQWRIIRAIAGSSKGITVAEIAQREETVIRTIYPDLEALQAAGFPLHPQKIEKASRWAFNDIFKFKIPPITSRKAAEFINNNLFEFGSPENKLIQFLGRTLQTQKEVTCKGIEGCYSLSFLS